MKWPEVWLATMLVLVLSLYGGLFILSIRRHRRTLARFRDWAEAGGLTVVWVRLLSDLSAPRELRRDPRSLGVHYFKFRAVRPDGTTRTGVARFPLIENRFAPPILVHWSEEGPSFDDLP